jgi:hypothetical protein
MQEQAAPGWRIVWSSRDLNGWSEPQPIDPGTHPDFEPRLGLTQTDLHAVWQRNSGPASEIIYAEFSGSLGIWTVENVTMNATEDVTPDLPTVIGAETHIAWVGLDPATQEGKIHHAVRSGLGWQIEVLAESSPGPFWTGAVPRIDVAQGIVHVVYRGGDFGDYHLHHARKEAGVWTYQILNSLNGNDFSVDVSAQGDNVVVAMSGNDGFGFPSHIYVRRSTNSGLSFGPPELVSGGFSASLENLVAGGNGMAISGSEVSGNIYTGNLLYALIDQPQPEILPPADTASEAPCAGLVLCIPGAHSPGSESVLYTNHQNAGADSAEVYFLTSPGPVEAIESGGVTAGGAELRLSVAPNPFSSWTRISVENAGGGQFERVEAAVYDLTGRLVRRLTPATGVLFWDGISEKGQPAPAGIYWIAVQTQGEWAGRSLVRVR